MIRYELEKKLIEGSLSVADIPAWWNEHYAAWLGVTVPDDKRGCLQDVHWSHGSFGYFPTYSLGSFYAAQFFAAAKNQVPGLEQAIGTGDTAPPAWLASGEHPPLGPALYQRGIMPKSDRKNTGYQLFFRLFT